MEFVVRQSANLAKFGLGALEGDYCLRTHLIDRVVRQELLLGDLFLGKSDSLFSLPDGLGGAGVHATHLVRGVGERLRTSVVELRRECASLVSLGLDRPQLLRHELHLRAYAHQGCGRMRLGWLSNTKPERQGRRRRL